MASIAELAQRSPYLYWPLRRTWTALATIVPPRAVPGIPGRVHYNDLLLGGRDSDSVRAYAHVGTQAVDLLERSLTMRGKTLLDVEHILDFGCGYGRVLRYLVQRVSPSRISACDLDPRAVQFCAREFGVQPVISKQELRAVRLGSYDLIWMGSVLTHVDPWTAEEMLRVLLEHLTENGIIAFTTLGASTLDQTSRFGSVRLQCPQILDQLASSGVCYVPYDHYFGNGYGLSWYTSQKVQTTVTSIGGERLSPVIYDPGSWASLQDFWAFAVV